MKYRKLELLFLALCFLAVLASIILSLSQKAHYSQILGQALFVPILFIALHYGRQPGFLAATGGALIYLISRSQELGSMNFATADGQFMLVRAVLFGLVGIFGSELATRTKYLIASLGGEGRVDERTHLYSKTYLQRLLSRLLSEYQYYARPFSIIFITLNWGGPIETGTREKSIARAANIIRSNLRLIDEIGFINDNCFCLVLPETPFNAAKSVFARIEDVYAQQPSSPARAPKMICERVLGMPEDETEIKVMLPELYAERRQA